MQKRRKTFATLYLDVEDVSVFYYARSLNEKLCLHIEMQDQPLSLYWVSKTSFSKYHSSIFRVWGDDRFTGEWSIYLFKVNILKTRRMCEISSKLTIKTPDDFVLVPLLLTLNRFPTLFYCFQSWFWTSIWYVGKILYIIENKPKQLKIKS